MLTSEVIRASNICTEIDSMHKKINGRDRILYEFWHFEAVLLSTEAAMVLCEHLQRSEHSQKAKIRTKIARNSIAAILCSCMLNKLINTNNI